MFIVQLFDIRLWLTNIGGKMWFLMRLPSSAIIMHNSNLLVCCFVCWLDWYYLWNFGCHFLQNDKLSWQVQKILLANIIKSQYGFSFTNEIGLLKELLLNIGFLILTYILWLSGYDYRVAMLSEVYLIATEIITLSL